MPTEETALQPYSAKSHLSLNCAESVHSNLRTDGGIVLCALSYLHGILPLGEMDLLLPLLLSDEGSLVLREPSAHGAGGLGAEVEGQVFLVLVEEAELMALVGVDDGEDASDRLADVVAIDPKKITLSASSVHISSISYFSPLLRLEIFPMVPLSHALTFIPEFLLHHWKDSETYILVSLEVAPPAIFCTRS